MSWIVRIDGAVERKSLGCLSMTGARCGGMFTATSISPFWSAATRTASSGIGLKTTVLILGAPRQRSEEHTSELQSLTNLVCRLLLEKKKNKKTNKAISAFIHIYNHI